MAEIKLEEETNCARTLGACICWILISAVGGATLVWWGIYYHPTNQQLWMVPFGLVVLGTPVVASVSILASELSLVSRPVAPACSTQDSERCLAESKNACKGSICISST